VTAGLLSLKVCANSLKRFPMSSPASTIFGRPSGVKTRSGLRCGGGCIYPSSDCRTSKLGDRRKQFSTGSALYFNLTKLPLRKSFTAIWIIPKHKDRDTRAGPKDHAQKRLPRWAPPSQRSARNPSMRHRTAM
jgi:hypothetical protein